MAGAQLTGPSHRIACGPQDASGRRANGDVTAARKTIHQSSVTFIAAGAVAEGS